MLTIWFLKVRAHRNPRFSPLRWLHQGRCKFDLRPKLGSILGVQWRTKGENEMVMQSRSAALRQEIESSLASRIPAALSPQAVQAPRLLPIGNEAVNALLGGGLPIGGICEFTGPASAGRTSLALSVLSAATVDSACAYIDVSDSLDARSAAAAGVRLKNLLWVRFLDVQEQGGHRCHRPQGEAGVLSQRES